MDEAQQEIHEKLQTLTAISLANTSAIQRLILQLSEKGGLSLSDLASLDTLMASPFQRGKLPETRAAAMLRPEHHQIFQLVRQAITQS